MAVHQRKRYYLETHAPLVFLKTRAQKISHGYVLCYSQKEFSIKIIEKIDPAEVQTEFSLYLGKMDLEHHLKNIDFSRLELGKENEGTLIDFSFKDEDSFLQFLSLLKKPQVPGSQGEQTDLLREFKKNRLPVFKKDEMYSGQAVEARCQWIEHVSGAKLHHIKNGRLNPKNLVGNIENYIGSIEIPLGVAGPVHIDGMYARGDIPVPLATTEGALVASVTRGAYICALAGGIKTHVIRQAMHRSPAFYCQDLFGAICLEKWILENKLAIARKAESYSSIAKVTDISTFLFGRFVHVTFSYATGDASGQNMTTMCTHFACEWIAEKVRDDQNIKFCNYLIEGNLASDKKAATINLTRGRGVSVYAEVFISNDILKKYLRTDIKSISAGFLNLEVASLCTGVMGNNVNYANAIAAIFTATGQDIACVHESSIGIFKGIEEKEGVIFSTYLPSLVIGTIGGGTGLPTQREALEIMNAAGQGKVLRLAEIIAATCLSLDISTSCAIVSHEFVQAHERLGRNRPERALGHSSLNTEFFNELLFDKSVKISRTEPLDVKISGSISNEVGRLNKKGFSGIFGFELSLEGLQTKLKTVLKLKNSYHELVQLGSALMRLAGHDELAGFMEMHHEVFGYKNCEIREIEFLKNIDIRLKTYTPQVFGGKIDHERQIYALLMEDLSPLELMNTSKSPDLWTSEHIESVLSALADIHSVYLEKYADIGEEKKVEKYLNNNLNDSYFFLLRLTEFNFNKFKEYVSIDYLNGLTNFIENIEDNIAKMRSAPQTLTHNDCSPRNICFRRTSENKLIPLFYDWELCAYQNPQRDVIEFLVFVAKESTSEETFKEHIIYYYKKLVEKTKVKIELHEFMEITKLNVFLHSLARINLLFLVSPVVDISFAARVCKNLEKILNISL